ncbi:MULTISPECIES: ADP-ribosylglycohydrolase family protein [unclassified Leptolyngbya]|uniref:ADP-ribosylglycohydrolase family protein n=1 Tax=unclassified Leptolyngbya TaxID=2650499 RepID=UPI001685F1EA|nr:MULTISPECIES: ADP-ribosylglycohydrolase family protein [unclassified Leptolyngbya]MBD1912520.1 ADP-ribosylglycohydrolase family protein [Leptolyngbya sp. FACHB-8]MBD2156469.1 ADP-ribosylglycohydrolase family protein [Leptolyngbya sp. FACHB-16]
MQYSLMARFRGTLLGAVLGHTMAERADEQPLEVGKSMVALLRHVGEEGGESIPWPALIAGSPSNPGARLAVVSIPLMLYYHDREAQLHQALQAAANAWNLPPGSTLAAMTLAEVLALALVEELELERLPLQLIESLELPSTSPAAQQLHHLQIAYQERYSWAIAQHHLQHLDLELSSETLPLSLLLAIYSFLRSPQDMRLAFSMPEHKHAGVTGLMVGAIAGSFNGTAKLPSHGWPSSITTMAWDLAQPQELQALSDQLLAHWAGVYRPHSQGAGLLKGAIAAPQLIRTSIQ